jgi:hypothetical protein
MVYKSRIKFAIDNFIIDNYFLPMKNIYELKETADSGKSVLKVNIENENICIEDYDNKPKCVFTREDKKYCMRKSVDHVLLLNDNDNWILHLIEMKSSLGNRTWIEVKGKFRASYLNMKALCEFLGISLSSVCTYTTFEKESFNTIQNLADPKTILPMLGEKAIDPKKDEWDKNIVTLNFGEGISFPHKSVKMTRNPNGELVGELSI